MEYKYYDIQLERNGKIIPNHENRVGMFSAAEADNFIKRLIGLMGKNPREFGPLWITPCNQIHMFNMKHPIDVVYLNKYNKIVHIDTDVKPWTVGKRVKDAHSVLELPVGYVEKFELAVDDRLVKK